MRVMKPKIDGGDSPPKKLKSFATKEPAEPKIATAKMKNVKVAKVKIVKPMAHKKIAMPTKAKKLAIVKIKDKG